MLPFTSWMLIAYLSAANAEKYCEDTSCSKKTVSENSLLQTKKSIHKGVSLPMEDEELTARDPAAGPPDEAELVIQDEGDIVFMEINETVAQEETKTTCMKVVLAILRRAKELDLANVRFNHTHTPELVMNDLKAALSQAKPL